MKRTTKPNYPPIAIAAQVEGNVIMLVNFKLNGEVEKIDVISGPEMLQDSATNYVQGWRANKYTGPRTCHIDVRFALFHKSDKPLPFIVRQDLQHVTVNAPAPLVEP
jgi:outer membrane biosynthesis protein TonB